MMEHIGLAAMLETPCVFVNVQRGGLNRIAHFARTGGYDASPLGQPRDYEIIALSPNSPRNVSI